MEFCRRSGDWKVGKKKDRTNVSWNGRIQSIMAKQIEEGFDSFGEELRTMEKDAIIDVSELFRKLDVKLEGEIFTISFP